MVVVQTREAVLHLLPGFTSGQGRRCDTDLIAHAVGLVLCLRWPLTGPEACALCQKRRMLLARSGVSRDLLAGQ